MYISLAIYAAALIRGGERLSWRGALGLPVGG
jgi:hypothetical protein